MFPVSLHAQNTSDDLEIDWENAGEITFLVDSNQWFQFTVGLNSTSQDLQSLNMEIIGETSWGIDDCVFLVKNQELSQNQSFELEGGENVNITVQVFVPETENGKPLSNINYQFRLQLTNEKGDNSPWNYSVMIRPKYSLTIDEKIERNEIAPLGNSIHEVKIRNTGNVLTTISPEIYPINSQGGIIENSEKTRFSFDGWNATISGFSGEISIQPNETKIVKISINSPYENQGNLTLVVKIKSYTGLIEKLIFFNSSIVITKDIQMEIINEKCIELLENQNCKLGLKLTNFGNYLDHLGQIFCNSTNEYIFFEANAVKHTILLNNNQTLTLKPEENIDFEIEINSTISKINAGSKEMIVCIHQRDNSSIVDEVFIEFEINEYHNLTSSDNPNHWIENDKFFISIEVKNNGNIPEGFSVGISVSHEGNHSLITPVNAIYDINATRVRGYTLENILPNQTVNITGWMEIPKSYFENESFWISVEVNSIPNFFENVWKVNNFSLALNIEKTNNDTGNTIKSHQFMNIFNTYGFPIIAIFISLLMITKAIKHRKQTKLNSKNIETNDDWIHKFYEKKEKEVNINSPKISKNQFEKEFFRNNNDEIKDYSIPDINIEQIKDISKKLNVTPIKNSDNLTDKNEEEYDFE